MCRDVLGRSDVELADLARQSVLAAAAPEPIKSSLCTGIDVWIG